MSPPYMVQLCGRLFPTADDTPMAGVCSNWLQQALDHCSAVLTKKPGCQKLWTRLLSLKRLLFAEQPTSLLSNKLPISVHPDILGPAECQELASQIAKDYVRRIPRYMDLLSISHSLWLILRGLFGLFVIGACLVLIARRYNALRNSGPNRASQGISISDRFLRKNIRRVIYETQHLSVVPEIDPSLLRCGCPTLGLKINGKKLSTIKAILVKIRDDPANADNAQSMTKLRRFFQHSGRYRLIIDLDVDSDEVDSKVIKSSAIPVHTPSRRIGIQRRPK